jgi:RHS repeat-associated protein
MRIKEANHGVGGATLAYDANGSMTTDDQGHTLTYDAWNRLVSLKNGGTTLVTYAYDGAGRRVTATASGTATDSYFAGGTVAEDYRSDQAYERTVAAPGYVKAVLLRAKDTDANGSLDQRVYFTADANANVTGVISTTGTVHQHQAYTAYGEVTFTDASWTTGIDGYALGRLFQGMRYDATSGWYVTPNRLYRAPLAYWNRVDPAQADGMNWYVPFANSPINRVDPSVLVVYVFAHGGEFTAVMGGAIQHYWAIDDAGYHASFWSVSLRLGVAVGGGGQVGIYSGTLTDFIAGNSVDIPGGYGIWAGQAALGFNGAGSGVQGGAGVSPPQLKGGLSLGLNYTIGNHKIYPPAPPPVAPAAPAPPGPPFVVLGPFAEMPNPMDNLRLGGPPTILPPNTLPPLPENTCAGPNYDIYFQSSSLLPSSGLQPYGSQTNLGVPLPPRALYLRKSTGPRIFNDPAKDSNLINRDKFRLVLNNGNVIEG